MPYTQRRFKFGVFCALVALLATVYPIRNATDRFNNAQVNADANEAASGSNDAQKLISAGEFHTCAVTTTGGVKCWGRGDSGQLGNNILGNSETPVDVTGMTSGVTSVTTGYSHSCGLLSSGSVKCWGYNAYGQLGDDINEYQSTPVEVSGLSGVQSISAGANHTCALLTSGAVKCWGYNGYGTLGDGTKPTLAERRTPVDVLSSGTAASSPVSLSGVVAISSGQRHTCALMTTNGVKCWGQNTNANPSTVGILGDGTTTERLNPVDVLASGTAASNPIALSNVVALSAGGSDSSGHTCVLLGSGGVSCWGSDNIGQLGNDELLVDSAYPVSVSGFSNSGAKAISSGKFHSCLITSFGEARCWGSGGYGQLGDGSQVDAKTPVTVRTSPTDSGPLRGVSAITTGGHHSCALLSSGKIYCWGSNQTSQIGRSTGAVYKEPVEISGSFLFGVPDSTAPAFSSAAVNPAGTTVSLTFSEAMSATTAATGAFSVVVNGTPVTPSSATVSGSTVVLGLTSAVQSGDTVTFTYTDPTTGNDANAVQDSVGNDVASISATSVTNASTVDTRAPTYSSASTSSDGTTISLTYSEALSATTASASAFSVVVGGAARSVSSAVVSGSTVVLTLSSAVGAGQAVTVAYTDPTAGNDANAVQDSAGNDAATLSATSVTNNVPQPSSGGSAPTNVTTTSTSSTSTTTTIASGPIAGTTTSMAPRRPRSTTTTSSTVAVRSGVTTSVPRRTTTSTTIARRPAGATSTSSSTVSTPSTSTTVARVTTTTIFKPLMPLAPVATIPTTTTTSSVVRSSNSSTAIVSTTSTSTTIARSVINNLSTAEEVLEIAKQSAGTNVLSAQTAVADLRLKLIDSKSAVSIAVKDAEKLVERLKSADASPEQIAQAEKRVVDLKIEIAEAKSISIEKILAAQEALEAVLADPRSTSVEIAEATAAFLDSRTPSLEDATKILSDVDDDPTLPLVIEGVVDNPREGSVVFFDNSESKSMQVVTLNNSAVRLQSNEGFNLTISSRNTNGEPVALGSNGQILVKHDNTISISGQGFAPNSIAKTWLFSSPRELGAINVNPDGTFAADHPIGKDIKVGLHTTQVNGISPDGEVRSLSISVEVVPNVGPAPFDPLGQPGNVLTLVAELVTLLAVAGASSGGGAGAGRRREEDEDDERGSAEVAEVSVAFGSAGVDRVRDRLPVLVVDVVDRLSVGAPRGVVGLSPMLARVFGDGVYLRSILGVLWLVLPFVGAGFGFGAASSSGFDAVMPSLFWLSALVVLGVFDAFSGFVGALMFGLAVGFGGGLVSADSVRGLLGVWVFCFAAPLIAGAVRPFRRVRGDSDNIVWDRCVDFVLIVLFGAWVAGSMYSALPGLTGFNSPSAGYVNHVRVVVLVALAVRFVLENFAVAVTPVRLKGLTREPLPEPTLQQKVVSVVVRTGVYMFVAVVFIGNNWALWLGGVLYLVPKLVSLSVDKLPDMRTLHRYLPRGIFKVVLMLFVAKWWGSIVAAQVDNPADMIKFGFVLLGIPGLALGAVGWFARSSRPWPSTIVTKLLGTALLIIGVLVVLNIWLAI